MKKSTKTRRTRRRRSTTPVRARRRRTTKKKGLLSEFINPAQAQVAAKTVAGGALGGLMAMWGEQIMNNNNIPAKNQPLWLGAMAFGVVHFLNAPNAGAGMAGVAGYKLAQDTGLADGEFQDVEYINDLEALPPFLNENGEAMDFALSDNGQFDLADDGQFDLSEQGYGVGYFNQGQGFGY